MHIAFINSFNLHIDFMMQMMYFFPFYRKESCSPESLFSGLHSEERAEARIKPRLSESTLHTSYPFTLLLE